MTEPKQRATGIMRRRIWQALGLGSMTSALGGTREPVVITRRSPTQRVANLTEVTNEPLDFEYPKGHAAFVVKLGRAAEHGVGRERDIVAFHRACPHRGCAIGLVDSRRGELGPCPCHASTFDLTCSGVQVYGMASQNLVQVVLDLRDGGELYAVGIVGLPYGEAVRER